MRPILGEPEALTNIHGKNNRQSNHCHDAALFFSFFFFSFVPTDIFPTGRFPQGKPAAIESRYPTLINYYVYAVFLCVTIPPAVTPTLSRQMDMGSLTCAHTCCVPYTRSGIGHKQVLAQELTRRDRKNVSDHAQPSQGIEPRVFGFELRCSNH